MNKIEKIRQEIERRKNYISVTHFAEELLSFLDTLSEEPDKSMEQPEGVEGIVHHYANLHCCYKYRAVNARLKDFEEGAEVRVFINARKGE